MHHSPVSRLRLEPGRRKEMSDISIRTLLLEFVDAHGASHIGQMHMEIPRHRPDMPV